MDPSPLGSPAGSDGVSGVDTNALDEALAESPIEKVTRLRREARRKKRGAGHKSAAAALELAQKHVPFFDLVKAIPDTNKYLASIEEPSLVVGVAPGRENLGERWFDARSDVGKVILAARGTKREVTDAPQPMEAEEVVVAMEAEDSLVAATASNVEVTDANRRSMAGVAARIANNEASLDRWEEMVDLNVRTWRNRLGPEGARRWTGDEPCPPWTFASENNKGPPLGEVRRYWRGPFPPGVTMRSDISWAKCEGIPAMEEAYRRAQKYKEARAIYDAEYKAFEECLRLSRLKGHNGGRGVPRVSYAAKDAYRAEQRAATEELIEKDIDRYRSSSLGSLKSQLALRDDILKALAAANGGLDWSALFRLDENGRRRYVAALARSSLPHIEGMLERTHLDHVDGGWTNEELAIREMLIRGLIDKILNERLPGIEWFKAHGLERAFFDTSYIKGALCCDRDYGAAFTTVFEIKKEWDWFGMNIAERQKKELDFIRLDLLSNVIWALGNDDVQLEPWDAMRLFLLKQRYPDLTFKHSPKSRRRRTEYRGHFWARFLNRGVVEMVVDHVGLGTFRHEGKLYRRVGVRGLLPEDVNFYASGYEWMTVLELEKYVDEYLANALYKKGSIGRVGIRPDFFKRK